MTKDRVSDEVIESGIRRRINKMSAPAPAYSAITARKRQPRNNRPARIRQISGAPVGLALAAIVATAGILIFRSGAFQGQTAPGAAGGVSSTGSVSSGVVAGTPTVAGSPTVAGTPRVAVQLSAIDLPGPVYDMVFDQSRDSLWYAYMSGSGTAALYQYNIASGKTAQWTLPPTDYNGYLDRVVLAPDGSVWLTENYSVVRVDPVSGSVVSHTFALADSDATSTALDPDDPSPGTWPTAITFDSSGNALVARHNVKSLVRLDSALAVVNRIQLPGSMVGPDDIVDSSGVIYAAPYAGTGPSVVFSEQGVLIGKTTQRVSRFAVAGGAVVALGSGGLIRVGSNAASTLWSPEVGGRPEDRLAVTNDGAAVYLDSQGTIDWISADGRVEGELSLAAVPVQVMNPIGTMVSLVERDHAGAIAIDGPGSVWYADTTSRQLVHIRI